MSINSESQSVIKPCIVLVINLQRFIFFDLTMSSRVISNQPLFEFEIVVNYSMISLIKCVPLSLTNSLGQPKCKI